MTFCEALCVSNAQVSRGEGHDPLPGGSKQAGERYWIGIGESFRCESNIEAETQALRHFVVNELPKGVMRSHQLGKRP